MSTGGTGMDMKVDRTVSSILSGNLNDEITSIDRFLGDTVIQALCERLIKERDKSTQSNKRKVVLRGNFIGATGATFISDLIKRYKELEFISLEWNQLGSPGARSLGEALVVSNTLTHLDLRNNSIATDGAIYLSNALQSNSTLKHLDLRWNQIEDQGALSFKDALTERIPRLELLINGNLLTDSATRYIEDWCSLGKDYLGAISDFDRDTKAKSAKFTLDPSLEKQTHIFQNELLQKEVSHLRHQCISLQSVFADAQRQLDTSSLRVTDLEQQLMREEYRSTHINEALKQANIRISVQADEYHTSRSSWESERACMNIELSELNKSHAKELQDMNTERNTYRDKMNKSQDEGSNIQIQQDRLIAQHKSEREEDKLELNKAFSDINKYKLMESRISSENFTIKSINSRLEDKVKGLEMELSTSRIEYDKALKASSEQYTADMERKKIEFAASMSASLESTGIQSKEISDLKAEVSALSSQLVSQRVDVERQYYENLKLCREEERGKGEAAVGELKQKIDILTATTTDLEARCGEYMREIQGLREEQAGSMDLLNTHLKSTKTELDRQGEANTGLQATIMVLEVENKKMLADLEEIKTRCDSARSEGEMWNRQLKALTTEKQIGDDRCASLQRQLEQLNLLRTKEFQMMKSKVAEANEKQFESLRIDMKILD